MAWTSPSSGAEFSVGELVTAAKMNTKITDNLRYLKGLDGNVGLGRPRSLRPACSTSTIRTWRALQ